MYTELFYRWKINQYDVIIYIMIMMQK